MDGFGAVGPSKPSRKSVKLAPVPSLAVPSCSPPVAAIGRYAAGDEGDEGNGDEGHEMSSVPARQAICRAECYHRSIGPGSTLPRLRRVQQTWMGRRGLCARFVVGSSSPSPPQIININTSSAHLKVPVRSAAQAGTQRIVGRCTAHAGRFAIFSGPQAAVSRLTTSLSALILVKHPSPWLP